MKSRFLFILPLLFVNILQVVAQEPSADFDKKDYQAERLDDAFINKGFAIVGNQLIFASSRRMEMKQNFDPNTMMLFNLYSVPISSDKDSPLKNTQALSFNIWSEWINDYAFSFDAINNIAYIQRSFDDNHGIYTSFYMGENAEWTVPEKLEINGVGQIAPVEQPAISPDGKTLLFVTNCPQGEGGRDLWMTKYIGGNIQKPQAEKVNKYGKILLTSKSASQKASKQTDNFNAAPIGEFVPNIANFDKIVNPDWTVPVKINAVNTEKDEMYPVWLNDNCFAFSSNGLPGEGGLDIYLAIREDENSDFSTVFMLEGPINSDYDDLLPICDKRSQKVFFNSDRDAIDGEAGGIYSFNFQNSKLMLHVAAKETNGVPIQSLVQIQSIGNDNLSLASNENGEVQYEIPNLSNDYEITVSSEGYIPQTKNFKANEVLQYLNTLAYQELIFFLEKENSPPLADNIAPILNQDKPAEQTNRPAENNINIALNNVYFDFDKEYCMEGGQSELDKLIAFGKKNPSYTIKVETHADERGSFAYNDKLAAKRLNFIKKYLTDNGIAANRIASKIHGKHRPYISNAQQPEEHLLNRRATFKIYTANGDLVNMFNDYLREAATGNIEGLHFRTQIAALSELPENPEKIFSKFYHLAQNLCIEYYKDADGLYKFTIGMEKDLKKAEHLHEKIKNIHEDAFMVAFKDGKRIPISEAKTLISY